MRGDKNAGKLFNEWKISSQVCSKDLLAYLKLRIITSALNEGWKPKFEEENELRCYPWFNLKTSSVISRVGYGAMRMRIYDLHSYSYSYAYSGSRLVFKSKELAEYAGKQFVEIYENWFI